MSDNEIIYVVDDDRDLRRSIVWMLSEAGYQTEAFASGEEFLESYDSNRVGCVLLDLQMPGISGIELQKKIIADQSPLCIIIVSAYGDVSRVVSTMRGGALDFVEKPFKRAVLIERIEQGIAQARVMKKDYSLREQIVEKIDSLTPREREVLLLVVQGVSTKEIAYRWSISARTVEVHRSHILKKMDADSVVQLVRMTMLAGVINEYVSGGENITAGADEASGGVFAHENTSLW